MTGRMILEILGIKKVVLVILAMTRTITDV
jgi:hypothetical protein